MGGKIRRRRQPKLRTEPREISRAAEVGCHSITGGNTRSTLLRAIARFLPERWRTRFALSRSPLSLLLPSPSFRSPCVAGQPNPVTARSCNCHCPPHHRFYEPDYSLFFGRVVSDGGGARWYPLLVMPRGAGDTTAGALPAVVRVSAAAALRHVASLLDDAHPSLQLLLAASDSSARFSVVDVLLSCLGVVAARSPPLPYVSVLASPPSSPRSPSPDGAVAMVEDAACQRTYCKHA